MNKLPILFSYKDIQNQFNKIDEFYYFAYSSMKKGTIKQIKRGLYALVDPSTNKIYANKFQVASSLYKDSFISYHEALEYYGLATQSFVSLCTSLSHFYASNLIFDGIKYEIKKNACAYQIINLMKEEGIRVVSLERAIVDCVDKISFSGGLDEIISAIRHCPKLDLDKVLEMLKIYDKQYLYIKVGYLFANYLSYKVDDCFINECKSHVTNKRNYLDKSSKSNTLDSEWNLLVPLSKGELINELF